MFKINIRALEQLMQDHQLSLSQLSENSGISKSALSKMLNGVTSSPSHETIKTLCDYFDIPFSSIVEKNDSLLVEKIFDKKKLRENIIQLMLSASIVSPYELHKVSGIAHQKIDRILQEDNDSKPHPQTLYELANFFGVTVSQIKGYENLPNTSVREDKFKIPLLDISDVKKFINGVLSKDKIQSYLSQLFESGHQLYAITIKSDTYFPAFKAGNIIIVDQHIKPHDGDYVIACIDDDEADIFEFINNNTASIKVVGKEHFYNIDEIKVDMLGVVVEIKLKII